MKNLAIARRYAKALLLISKEDGQTDTYRNELGGFADLMAHEKSLNEAITNPLYETAGRRNVLQAVIDKLDLTRTMKSLNEAITNPLYETAGRRNVLQAVIDKLDFTRTMKSFLLLIFDKGRIGFIDSINDYYQKLADELKGVARASLVSAIDLSAETVEKIRVALSKKINKDVILEVEQDSELIGGIITKIGDLVWDGSIKTQLINMRESLKRGERA